MLSEQLKQIEGQKARAERELARLRAQLAGRENLIRRLRSQQQWATEALSSVHVPLLALSEKGALFWLNDAAIKLLGLKKAAADIANDDLPGSLRQLFAQGLERAKQSDKPAEAPLKLHGQAYRVSMQFLAAGSADANLQSQSLAYRAAQCLVSLVPEQGDIIAQEIGYPDLPEVSLGADGGGALDLRIELAGQELEISLQPVLALQQFLGIEQLARLQYQAHASLNTDLALIKMLCERIISDRLGALRAGAWMLRLSPEALHDRDFSGRLMSLLGQYQVSGSRFVFGVAEDEVMDSLVLMRQLQSDLMSSGLRWALLDTSADMGNFEYLAPLGFDFYCISPDLVAQSAVQERGRKVLSALHDAASGLGMATLATAVDSAEAMTAIRAAGIDYASGSWASHEFETL